MMGATKLQQNFVSTFRSSLHQIEANKLKKARKMKKPRYGAITQCFQKAKAKITDDSNIIDNDESSDSSSESSD